MIKKLRILTVLLILSQIIFAKERYDKVRVWSDNTAKAVTEMLISGLDPEAMTVRNNVYIDVIVSQEERNQLEIKGMAPEELIVDMSSYYASHLDQTVTREMGYGSMGGYYTYSEILESVDSLHAQYPEIVSARDSIGVSYEGRAIWAFKISDNPDQDEAEPEVLYNSLIHAREPAAMMTLMYFAWELAENYNQDSIMSYLVNEREMWFIPVVNPDGYLYNELINPDGGGMHRKNRRPGCTSYPGVDLNRNWGYEWGYDDEGSSPDDCAATYRGEQAFSEPETQALRFFMLIHDFQTVFNYHSYGNLLIRPFGYDDSVPLPEPDDDIYMQMGPDLVAENHYLFGTGDETVGYLTNGDAVDYMYGDLGIINFTPEVGAPEEGGFWPPTALIFELAEENLSMNIHLAAVAGAWIELGDFELNTDGNLQDGNVATCELWVSNKGLANAENTVTLHLSSPDSSMIPSEQNFNLSDLAPQISTDLGSTGLTFEVNTQGENLAQLVLAIEVEGHFSVADTFYWSVGAPDTVFTDDFEQGTSLWESDEWGATDDAYSGSQAMTDSPVGDYPASTEVGVTLIEPIDLRGYTTPILTFDAKWDIEVNYDFCQVLASIDGGVRWIPLEGDFTVAGNGTTVQPSGEPGYHGIHGWVHESMSLEQFTDSPSLLLSFLTLSDTYYEGDGFVVDNLMVQAWGIGFHAGDITRDGLVNILDAVFLLERISDNTELTSDELELSDLNVDTVVDIRDMVLLIEKIMED